MKQLLQNARWIGLLIYLSMMLNFLPVTTEAAMLTLKGEATVASVATGESGLPFSVAKGDRLTFLVTIDSMSPTGGQSGLFASFNVQIGGFSLTDAELAVIVSNNRLGDSVLALAEEFIVDDPGGYRDGITISASHRPFNERATGRIDGLPSPQFETSIGFLTSLSRLLIPIAYPTILSTESLPLDPQVWNAFEAREFALYFLPDNSRIGAYIDAVAIVPEPTAAHMFIFSAATLIGMISRVATRPRLPRALEKSLTMQPLLQNARWTGLALFALLCGPRDSDCAAAPLMLRGTATVATVYDDFERDGTIRRLPFSMHKGGTFRFYLSIESQTPASDQPSGFATFRSTIDGVQLEHTQLEVVVGNDSGVDVLSIAAPAAVDIGAIVGDTILLRKFHQFGESEYAGAVSSGDAPAFRLDVGFLEYVKKNLPDGSPQTFPAILNDASIPQNAATWQAFSDREIAILFENFAFVGAYITEIVVVPEPSALAICGCCLPWLGSRFVRRRPYLTSAARS